MMANSVAALSAQDEDMRTRACRLYSETLTLFNRRITEARDSGEIDEDIDPESTARALIAVRQGIEFLTRSRDDGRPHRRTRPVSKRNRDGQGFEPVPS
ncbi:TetR family transcriptional regulator C-terminal domain-containing protein [Amycolatopsis sp. 3B14]|uniref:TetR family transcriptional regulator C-terminal domain-containing protein n=1 Tax=Amycolatopsis sp. 3B14 TaxID=3243600 RepID=UPI003D9617E0